MNLRTGLSASERRRRRKRLELHDSTSTNVEAKISATLMPKSGFRPTIEEGRAFKSNQHISMAKGARIDD
jgi:hypothetical protein